MAIFTDMRYDCEELREQTLAAYMRGFRCAVNLEDPGPLHLDSHFARGHLAGIASLVVARIGARENADRVLESPAMAQAQENAGSGQ